MIDPSKLSLAERVKLFSQKVEHQKPIVRDVKRGGLRFKTQPITIEELLVAKNKNATNSSHFDGLSFRHILYIYLFVFIYLFINLIVVKYLVFFFAFSHY